MAGRISKAAFPRARKADHLIAFREARDELKRRIVDLTESERWRAQGMALGIAIQHCATEPEEARRLVAEGIDMAMKQTQRRERP